MKDSHILIKIKTTSSLSEIELSSIGLPIGVRNRWTQVHVGHLCRIDIEGNQFKVVVKKQMSLSYVLFQKLKVIGLLGCNITHYKWIETAYIVVNLVDCRPKLTLLPYPSREFCRHSLS